MSKFKKLVVAFSAMAAVCFSIGNTTTANAAVDINGRCVKHSLVRENEYYEFVEATSRPFAIYLDYDNDGMLEIISEVCTEVTYNYMYDAVCTKCYLMYPDQYGGEYISHSESKCPAR